MLPNILDETTSTTRLLAVKYKVPANCPNLTSATLPVHPRQDVNRCAFARRLACLDPVNIVTSSTQTASQFKPVIDHLVKHQHLTSRFGSMMNLSTMLLVRIYQYSRSLTSTNSASLSFFNSMLQIVAASPSCGM